MGALSSIWFLDRSDYLSDAGRGWLASRGLYVVAPVA